MLPLLLVQSLRKLQTHQIDGRDSLNGNTPSNCKAHAGMLASMRLHAKQPRNGRVLMQCLSHRPTYGCGENCCMHARMHACQTTNNMGAANGLPALCCKPPIPSPLTDPAKNVLPPHPSLPTCALLQSPLCPVKTAASITQQERKQQQQPNAASAREKRTEDTMVGE